MTENTEGNALAAGRAALDAEQQGRMNRFALCVPLAISVYSLSALFWFHLRRDTIDVRSSLQALYASVYGWFGFSACIVFFLLLLIWTSVWFFAGRVDRPVSRLLRLVSVAVMLGVFLSLGKTAADGPTQGELGFYLAQRLIAAIGYPVSWLFVFVGTVASLLLATDFFFSESFEKAFGWNSLQKERDAARERGVEAAVTEHLKGLAQTAPSRAPAPSVDAMELAAALAEAAEASGGESEGDAAARFEAPSEPPSAPTEEPRRSGRRRSYFERRYEDVAAETWVPAAPEPQEIDNPESDVAEDAAALQGEVTPAEPVPEVEAGPVAETSADALVRGEAFAIDEGELDGGAAVAKAAVDDSGVDDAEVAEDEVDEAGDEPLQLTVEELAAAAEPEAAGDGEDEDLPDELTADREPRDLRLPAGAEPFAATGELEAEQLEVEEVEAEDDEDAADASALPTFAIPRPEPQAEPEPTTASLDVPEPVASASEDTAEPEAHAARQRGLFGPAFDEDLLAAAKQIVLESHRPTAALLRRRLRIGYEEACEVLAELSARGVVDLSGDG